MNSSRAVVLRLARLQDAPVMAGMSRQFIEAGLDWRYTPRRVGGLIGDPDTVALVACDPTGLQGFAVMQFGDARAHLILLCVQPAWQQHGIGRRLVEWLLESVRVAGLDTVQVELRAGNAAALAFYRRLGFAETALLPDYYNGQFAARRMLLSLRQDAQTS